MKGDCLFNIFKVLGNNDRLKIFIMLLHDEYCGCHIECFLNLSQSNVSKHLKYLKTHHLATLRKENKWRHYSIPNDIRGHLKDLINYIEKLDIYKQLNLELKQFSKQPCEYYRK